MLVDIAVVAVGFDYPASSISHLNLPPLPGLALGLPDLPADACFLYLVPAASSVSSSSSSGLLRLPLSSLVSFSSCSMRAALDQQCAQACTQPRETHAHTYHSGIALCFSDTLQEHEYALLLGRVELQLLADQGLDTLKELDIVLRDERDRTSTTTSSCRTTDSMDVVLAVGRDIKVEDQVYVRDIEATVIHAQS